MLPDKRYDPPPVRASRRGERRVSAEVLRLRGTIIPYAQDDKLELERRIRRAVDCIGGHIARVTPAHTTQSLANSDLFGRAMGSKVRPRQPRMLLGVGAPLFKIEPICSVVALKNDESLLTIRR